MKDGQIAIFGSFFDGRFLWGLLYRTLFLIDLLDLGHLTGRGARWYRPGSGPGFVGRRGFRVCQLCSASRAEIRTGGDLLPAVLAELWASSRLFPEYFF